MSDIRTGYIEDSYDERDLVFGSDASLEHKFAGRAVLNPSGNWETWLPSTEHQAPDYETQACVSFNTLNCVEILRKFQEDLDVNLSDRFVARISGTNPNAGNSPRVVANAVKKFWSVKEPEWPRPATLEEFYANIPEKLRSLAIGRGSKYEFGYEQVPYSSIPMALTFSPLGISVPAWFLGKGGKYYRPAGQRDTHWCVCIGQTPEGDLLVFDSYNPFIKVLSKDVIPEVVYSYYLKTQVNVSLWEKFLKIFEDWFGG